MREEAAAAGKDIVVVRDGDGIMGALCHTLLGSDHGNRGGIGGKGKSC